MKTVEEIALAVCEKIGPVAMCKDPLAFSEMVVAAVDAERGEDAVAWVDVVDRHEGPYKFHGKELLDSGKHNLYTTPQPCPKCAEGMVSVAKEDANNYCRILTLLGMEEEGSPVEAVERLISLRDGMTCGDCNDTGWLENREEGRYPCTCMTEAEPYQLLQAKCAELEHAVFRVMNLLTRYLDDDQFNAIESIVEAAKVGPHTEIVELRAKCASLDHQVSEGHKNTLRLESVIRDFEAQTKELEASRPICSTCACEIDKAAGVDVAKLNNQIKEVEAELAQLDGVKQIAVRDTLAFRAERDALAMQNQQMREALTLWKIASDNSEEVEFDEMAAYSIPMPLFCDADEATEAALVLPDNTEAIIKRHDSAIRDEMIDLFRLKHRDYANELAAELEKS